MLYRIFKLNTKNYEGEEAQYLTFSNPPMNFVNHLHDSQESAFLEIKTKANLLKGYNLVVLPYTLISCDGDVL